MVQIAATKLSSFWYPCLPQSERFSVGHERRSQILVAKKHESECRENSSPMALLWEWDYQDFAATLKIFVFQSHLLLDGGIFDSKLTEILLSVATLIFEFQVWDKSIKCVFFGFWTIGFLSSFEKPFLQLKHAPQVRNFRLWLSWRTQPWISKAKLAWKLSWIVFITFFLVSSDHRESDAPIGIGNFSINFASSKSTVPKEVLLGATKPRVTEKFGFQIRNKSNSEANFVLLRLQDFRVGNKKVLPRHNLFLHLGIFWTSSSFRTSTLYLEQIWTWPSR